MGFASIDPHIVVISAPVNFDAPLFWCEAGSGVRHLNLARMGVFGFRAHFGVLIGNYFFRSAGGMGNEHDGMLLHSETHQ